MVHNKKHGPSRPTSWTWKGVQEEQRLKKDPRLSAKIAGEMLGVGSGFVGAWEPIATDTGVSVKGQSLAYKAGWTVGHGWGMGTVAKGGLRAGRVGVKIARTGKVPPIKRPRVPGSKLASRVVRAGGVGKRKSLGSIRGVPKSLRNAQAISKLNPSKALPTRFRRGKQGHVMSKKDRALHDRARRAEDNAAILREKLLKMDLDAAQLKKFKSDEFKRRMLGRGGPIR